MDSKLILRGGTVIDASGGRRADVLVDGERIVAVGPDLDLDVPGARLVDAGGAYVIPGGIDAHTHFGLPVGAVTSADDFESGTLAAACGGTTCVVDFCGAGREPWEEALATWHERAAGRAVIDYGFHLTVTELPEQPEAASRRFRAFSDRGITSVKLYMAYPDRLMVDDETLARAFAASRETGVRVCVHAEDGATIEALIAGALAAGRTGPDAIPSVRPPSVEADAIRRAADLAAAERAWLHVVHLSSEEGLRAVLDARAGGVNIHTETCPHYLYLDQSHLDAGEVDYVCAADPSSVRPRRVVVGARRGRRRARDDRPLPLHHRRPSQGHQGDRLGELHRDPRRAQRRRDPPIAHVPGRS